MVNKPSSKFLLLYLVTHVEGPEEDHPGPEQVQHRHLCSGCVTVILVAVQLYLAHVRGPHQVHRHLLVVLPRRPLYDLLGLLHTAMAEEPPHGLRHHPVEGDKEQQREVGQHLRGKGKYIKVLNKKSVSKNIFVTE